MEGEAQASLHRPAAVGAVVDTAAEPLPLGSVDARVAVGYPAGQVPAQVGPVEVLGDGPLADAVAVVTLVVMELLQDGVHLQSKATLVVWMSWMGLAEIQYNFANFKMLQQHNAHRCLIRI